jgi:hypothetical protein
VTLASQLSRHIALLALLAPAALHAQGDKGKGGTLSAEECADFRVRWAKDTTIKGVHPAEAKERIVLPQFPADDRGKEVEVRVLVNVRGAVDSVRVAGMVSTTTEERLRTVLSRVLFKPSTYQGCTVPFWVTFRVTT